MIIGLIININLNYKVSAILYTLIIYFYIHRYSYCLPLLFLYYIILFLNLYLLNCVIMKLLDPKESSKVLSSVHIKYKISNHSSTSNDCY